MFGFFRDSDAYMQNLFVIWDENRRVKQKEMFGFWRWKWSNSSKKCQKRCWQSRMRAVYSYHSVWHGTDPWKRYRIKKNADMIFMSHVQKRQSIRNEFWTWRRLQESIQDLTREFDPGSGRTLAACLTHASRAGMWISLLRSILAADGWVTREQPASNRGITHRKMC